jgi:hypothetical protein
VASFALHASLFLQVVCRPTCKVVLLMTCKGCYLGAATLLLLICKHVQPVLVGFLQVLLHNMI